MDNNQDERRIFSHQTGYKKKKKIISGKEKIKRLSVVEREMGFNDEDELQSTSVNSTKFKLPKKIFSDSNASIPKKLRSAIRKRSCESTSGRFSDAKRSSNRANDVDLLGKDGLKKSKISMQNGWSEQSSKGAVSATISKDEKEVAETLFALAGMVPLNRGNDKTENESLGSKTSNLSAKQTSDPTPLSEGTVIPKQESEATNPTPKTNGSPKDATIDSAPFVWPKLSERRQVNLDFKVSLPPVHFQIPSLLRACDDRQLTSSTFVVSTEQNRESGFNDTGEVKSQLPTRESHISLGVVDLAFTQDRQHATSTQCRDNDLTSRPLHDSGFDRLPVQINNTSPSKPTLGEDTPSASKAFGSVNDVKKSWRRCIAHVYISRLIQVLQTSEGKYTGPSDTNRLRSSQQSSAGQVADNRDDQNGPLAAGHMLGSAANDVQVQLRNGQVKEEGPPFSGCFGSKKQSYNFLSLSTGAGPEVNNGVNRFGVSLEAKGQEYQLNSVAQRNTYMTNSMPQNCFPSVSYRDQIAGVSTPPPSMPLQVHLQVPPYYSNPCGSGHMSTTRSTHQPQSKQQQQIWAAQLAAQFRPGSLLPSHIGNWQNSTLDPHMMNHMQPHLPPPRPSLETIGSKYLHISQQQHQQLLGHRPAMHSSNAKLQSSQLPSAFEDKGGRFHPDGVLPVQLLCNERLLS